MERELERQQRAKKREEIEDTLEMVTLVVVVGLFAGGLLFGSHWAICLAGWSICAFIAYRLGSKVYYLQHQR